MNQCNAITKKGTRCRVLTTGDYCEWHWHQQAKHDGKVKDIPIESAELPRGVVKFEKAKGKRERPNKYVRDWWNDR